MVWPRWLWALTVLVLQVKQSLPCFPINPTSDIYTHFLVYHGASQTAVSGRFSSHSQCIPNRSSCGGGLSGKKTFSGTAWPPSCGFSSEWKYFLADSQSRAPQMRMHGWGRGWLNGQEGGKVIIIRALVAQRWMPT